MVLIITLMCRLPLHLIAYRCLEQEQINMMGINVSQSRNIVINNDNQAYTHMVGDFVFPLTCCTLLIERE